VGGELTGCRVSAGEEETAGWRMASASPAHGRTADCGTMALAGAAAAQLHKEEDDPGVLGWSGPKLGRL
jgi:hypothetical protein